MPRALQIERFVSERSAHAHLFKHLVPLHGAEDAERWAELIPEPPFPARLSERRKQALGHCEGVPGCALPHHPQPETCVGCRDSRAQATVSTRLGPLLEAYLAEGARAFAWALANPGPNGPRVFAFTSESDRSGRVRLRAADNRRLLAVATRDASGPDALLTCYRRNDMPVSLLFLKLARERVGHRNAGTLVPLVVDREGEP